MLVVQVPLGGLRATLRESFVPGIEISCDKCLRPCGGLTKHDSMEH